MEGNHRYQTWNGDHVGDRGAAGVTLKAFCLSWVTSMLKQSTLSDYIRKPTGMPQYVLVKCRNDWFV